MSVQKMNRLSIGILLLGVLLSVGITTHQWLYRETLRRQVRETSRKREELSRQLAALTGTSSSSEADGHEHAPDSAPTD